MGYIPFQPEAANLFFQLVPSRYERASLIVTSNKPFGRWGEVFGDDVVAALISTHQRIKYSLNCGFVSWTDVHDRRWIAAGVAVRG